MFDEVNDLIATFRGWKPRHQHLDEADDDYGFVEQSLMRWADRRTPKSPVRPLRYFVAES